MLGEEDNGYQVVGGNKRMEKLL